MLRERERVSERARERGESNSGGAERGGMTYFFKRMGL